MEPINESRILYLNEACVVVNKVPGEAAEGARPGMADLPRLLAEYFGGGHPGKMPEAVHRLDVPASGCVLFSRNREAQAFLSAAFARREVEKRYWAILETPSPGTAIPEAGELVHWIETDRQRNKSAAYTGEKPGLKQAVLRYRVLGRGERYLFWEIELITGRQHQIRAQLAALGFHIKGDLKYGARRSEKRGGIRLHARSLVFPNPLKPGEMAKVTAPPPFTDNLWRAFEDVSGP